MTAAQSALGAGNDLGLDDEAMHSKTAKSMTRVQMDLSPNSMERLKKLKENVDAPSYAEVMREALKLYEFLINEELKGSEFLVKRKGKDPAAIKLFIL